MKPKKHLGQNFLINKNIVYKIANSVNIKDEVVLEIGPGRGALSLALIENAKQVYAFEVDEALKKYLNPLEESNNNFKVIYDDVLNIDFNEFSKEINEDKLILMANIPYYITGPLLNKIKDTKNIKKAVIMMQKEVAERLTATTNNKSYGNLTVTFNLHFQIQKIVNVKRTNFYPAPKVDSVVLKFVRTEKYQNKVNNQTNFYEFVNAAFKMKRKTLVNNLSNYYKITKEETIRKLKEIEPAFETLERAENITLKRFISFSNGWYKWLKKHTLKST